MLKWLLLVLLAPQTLSGVELTPSQLTAISEALMTTVTRRQLMQLFQVPQLNPCLHFSSAAPAFEGSVDSLINGSWVLRVTLQPKLTIGGGCRGNETASSPSGGTGDKTSNATESLSRAFAFNGNENYSSDGVLQLPITFKQSVVFTACGIVIAAFFCVAAVLRLRNRLKKKLNKRRAIEKEAKVTQSKATSSSIEMHLPSVSVKYPRNSVATVDCKTQQRRCSTLDYVGAISVDLEPRTLASEQPEAAPTPVSAHKRLLEEAGDLGRHYRCLAAQNADLHRLPMRRSSALAQPGSAAAGSQLRFARPPERRQRRQTTSEGPSEDWLQLQRLRLQQVLHDDDGSSDDDGIHL